MDRQAGDAKESGEIPLEVTVTLCCHRYRNEAFFPISAPAGRAKNVLNLSFILRRSAQPCCGVFGRANDSRFRVTPGCSNEWSRRANSAMPTMFCGVFAA